VTDKRQKKQNLLEVRSLSHKLPGLRPRTPETNEEAARMSFRVQSLFWKVGLIFAAPILLAGAFSPAVRPISPSSSKHSQGLSKDPLHEYSCLFSSSKDLDTNESNSKKSDTEDTMLLQAFKFVGKSTSAVVAGTFYIVLAYRRDALMVSFFIGAISNGILSKVLKKVLNISRPEELNLQELDLKPSDNGMPSSHAMSLGFIGTFTALSLPSTTIPIVLYSLVSLVYRVQTKLHTFDQVLVGGIVGSLNGWLWKVLCTNDNPFGVTVTDWVSSMFLNEQRLLPYWALTIPGLVGALVVGSFERRIARYLEQRKKKD
jgi:membrane-associated phospholipid phosphatase